MTCPRCLADFETGPGNCPKCGIALLRSVAGVMKTSAVMIAAAGEQGFYRSVQDVPEPLRSQLRQVTTSANSGTIVIADRAGKDQLTQVIGRRESPRDTLPPVLARRFLTLPWTFWAGMLLVLFAAGIIAAVFAIHW